MINIAEWTQNHKNPEELLIKARLLGGYAAIFMLDRQAVLRLPRICVLHITLADRLEELLLCDFKGLRKFPAGSGTVFPVLTARPHMTDGSGIESPLEGSYSIRLAEKTDQPWLGPEGWQETRHYFEFPGAGVKPTSAVNDQPANGNHPLRKKALVAALALIILAAGSAAFWPGYPGVPAPDAREAKPSRNKEIAMASVAAEPASDKASPVPAASQENKKQEIPEVRKTEEPKRSAHKVAPERRVKQHEKKQKKQLQAVWKSGRAATSKAEAEPRISLPCTPDMKEKGIGCN
jgi:hypothetical protein